MFRGGTCRGGTFRGGMFREGMVRQGTFIEGMFIECLERGNMGCVLLAGVFSDEKKLTDFK